MEDKQIISDYLDTMKAVRTEKAFIFCKKCGELKKAISIDPMINNICDECNDKMMEGIKIPTFDA